MSPPSAGTSCLVLWGEEEGEGPSLVRLPSFLLWAGSLWKGRQQLASEEMAYGILSALFVAEIGSPSGPEWSRRSELAVRGGS